MVKGDLLNNDDNSVVSFLYFSVLTCYWYSLEVQARRGPSNEYPCNIHMFLWNTGKTYPELSSNFSGNMVVNFSGFRVESGFVITIR